MSFIPFSFWSKKYLAILAWGLVWRLPWCHLWKYDVWRNPTSHLPSRNHISNEHILKYFMKITATCTSHRHVKCYYQTVALVQSETTQCEHVCSMHGNFLMNCYKSDSHVTRQAASHTRQKLCWVARGLLQVSAVHGRQARLLYIAKIPPAGSLFEFTA